MSIRTIMPQEKYKICLEIQISVVSRLILCLTAFNIMTGLIPGISVKNVFAQSTYIGNKPVGQNGPTRQKLTITPKPKPAFNMPTRTVNRVGSTFSGRNSISIKSSDAGITPRYQQPSQCMDCGVIDFVNVIEPGYAAGVISGGIISGVIGSKIFRRDAHKYHSTDTDMGKNSFPGHHFNGGPANHMMNDDNGITMDGDTQAIIKQQTAPHFHRGDRVKLFDGVLRPSQ